jgi:hypothetical protein
MDFCPASAALASPVQIIFFSSHTFSLYKSPSPSNLGTGAGSRAGSHVSVSLVVPPVRFAYPLGSSDFDIFLNKFNMFHVFLV